MNLPRIKKLLSTVVGPLLALAFIYWTHTIPRMSATDPAILAIGGALVLIGIGGMYRRTETPGAVENSFWLLHAALCLVWIAKTPMGWQGNILTPIIGFTLGLMMVYRIIVPPKKPPKKTQS